MEILDEIICLLLKKIEEILKRETAITSNDINAVKELSIIVNLNQIHLSGNRYVLAGRSGRASQHLSMEEKT